MEVSELRGRISAATEAKPAPPDEQGHRSDSVDDEGNATETAFGGSLDDEPLEDCVRKAMADWSFPPARNGRCAKVTIPFALGMEKRK